MLSSRLSFVIVLTVGDKLNDVWLSRDSLLKYKFIFNQRCPRRRGLGYLNSLVSLERHRANVKCLTQGKTVIPPGLKPWSLENSTPVNPVFRARVPRLVSPNGYTASFPRGWECSTFDHKTVISNAFLTKLVARWKWNSTSLKITKTNIFLLYFFSMLLNKNDNIPLRRIWYGWTRFVTLTFAQRRQ